MVLVVGAAVVGCPLEARDLLGSAGECAYVIGDDDDDDDSSES